MRTILGALESIDRSCYPAEAMASKVQKLAENSKQNGAMIDGNDGRFGELKCLNKPMGMRYNTQRLKTSSLKNGKCWILQMEEIA